MTSSKPELPIIPFAAEAEFEGWLSDHADEPHGIWLKIAKKASGIKSVTYHEALDVALCYGWIDGQRRRFDDDYFLQRFTPRRSRSRWSQVNRDHVERLIAEGRMQPAGQAQIDVAVADGRWADAYPPQSQMEVPDDLQARLNEHPAASEFFESLDSRNRFAFLYRLHDAKRSDTRARRLEQFMTMLSEGEKLY